MGGSDDVEKDMVYLQQTNFSLAAGFWGICLLSAFILLRRLKLASVSIFHSWRPQRWWQVNQSQFIDGETSFAFSNASSVLIQIDAVLLFAEGRWQTVIMLIYFSKYSTSLWTRKMLSRPKSQYVLPASSPNGVMTLLLLHGSFLLLFCSIVSLVFFLTICLMLIYWFECFLFPDLNFLISYIFRSLITSTFREKLAKPLTFRA